MNRFERGERGNMQNLEAREERIEMMQMQHKTVCYRPCRDKSSSRDKSRSC